MSRDKQIEIERMATRRARELRRNSTPAETILWKALRAKRLNGLSFYRQRPVYCDVDGRETFFIPDFYSHKARLVIELDGGIHETTRAKDQARTEVLNHLGIRVIRFTNEEVLDDLDSVLATIHRSCALPKRSPLPSR